MNERAIQITTGYRANTKEPFVEMNVPKRRIQMSPENARDLALNLLQAAEAAYSDAFLVEFYRDALQAEEELTAGVLIEFRKWRETKQEW